MGLSEGIEVRTGRDASIGGVTVLMNVEAVKAGDVVLMVKAHLPDRYLKPTLVYETTRGYTLSLRVSNCAPRISPYSLDTK
uniref:Uncharacterized protein n=1 Tax=Pristionchus pacificus TaxID=54126 RepID=A0A2A6BCX9_PRIPA|eukprot:PDM63742.1 hypothetical protein PRIPAC_49715 [Pristionchus pacificus]